MESPAASFTFDTFEIAQDSQTLHFTYKITLRDGTEHELTEIIKLPVVIEAPRHRLITKLLQNLHLALGISYYKIFLPPQIIQPYKLDKTAADFWNNVYREGLAEFLYENSLHPESVAEFAVTPDYAEAEEPLPKDTLREEVILAIGGGKDSLVGGEILRDIDIPMVGYTLGTGDHLGQAQSVANAMQTPLLGVERTLDPKIFELNQAEGSLNGHVPISMIFAFVGLLLCVVTGRKYMVVNNEASASIPNTTWQGMVINHQWSKSAHFEQLLQNFVHTQLYEDLHYFSVIRPMSSVAVCKATATYPQYLKVFTSCNLVFRIDPARRPNGRWCGQCAKCVSSFILFLPWLNTAQMHDVFGANFLNDGNKERLFLELCGLEGHKPLDCVGTPEELVLSLNLAAEQKKLENAVLMKLAYTKEIIHKDNWAGKLSSTLQLKPEQYFPPRIEDQLLASASAYVREAL